MNHIHPFASHEDAQFVHDEWDRRTRAHDIDGLLELYLPDAALESPLIPRIMDQERGILRGHEGMRDFFIKGTAGRPNELVRWYRSGTFMFDGRTLIWEYPGKAPPPTGSRSTSSRSWTSQVRASSTIASTGGGSARPSFSDRDRTPLAGRIGEHFDPTIERRLATDEASSTMPPALKAAGAMSWTARQEIVGPTGGPRHRTPCYGVSSATELPYPVALSHKQDNAAGVSGQRTESGASSGGQRNTSASTCDGVLKPRVCRGRRLSWSAMASKSAWVRVRKSRVRGRYWRRSPLVFSLLPRCRAATGSWGHRSRPRLRWLR
jgi:hypothetical protein